MINKTFLDVCALNGRDVEEGGVGLKVETESSAINRGNSATKGGVLGIKITHQNSGHAWRERRKMFGFQAIRERVNIIDISRGTMDKNCYAKVIRGCDGRGRE